MVDLSGSYVITPNRESGFGRYDVVLKPKNTADSAMGTGNGKAPGSFHSPAQKDAIIMEFKVHDPEDEKTLEETAEYVIIFSEIISGNKKMPRMKQADAWACMKA